MGKGKRGANVLEIWS